MMIALANELPLSYHYKNYCIPKLIHNLTIYSNIARIDETFYLSRTEPLNSTQITLEFIDLHVGKF